MRGERRDERPRVMHVVVAGDIGGAEKMLVDLASRGPESRASHAVALMTPNAALADMLRGAGLSVTDRGRVRENPAAFLWRSLGPADVAWLARALREERASIVHLHTFASQVVGTRAAQRIGARIVRTEHSTRVYKDPSCWPFSRWSLVRAHAVVAISEHIAAAARAKAPTPATPLIRVVRNGVDTARFTPRVRERERDHTAPFRFAIVGRLEPRKGVDLALDALALEPSGATLDVVGDGDERASLERRASARGLGARVRFHGFVADPRGIVAACDAVLCSSREEGLGIALLEAMAMARPVVGFRVGGVPEIVEDDVTGLLATDGTSAALAKRMREAIAMGARLPALGDAARAFVVRACSIEAMCEGYARVYDDVLAGG